MTLGEMRDQINRLIADLGEKTEIEVSIDVGSEDEPFLRAFGSPEEIIPGAKGCPAMLLATGYINGDKSSE